VSGSIGGGVSCNGHCREDWGCYMVPRRLITNCGLYGIYRSKVYKNAGLRILDVKVSRTCALCKLISGLVGGICVWLKNGKLKRGSYCGVGMNDVGSPPLGGSS